MIISHSHKFVFIHVHKTAGESVSAALAPILGKQDLLVEGAVRTALQRRFAPKYRAARQLTKHSPAADVRTYLGEQQWADMYRFAVVRDPVRRAISLYTYLQTVRDGIAASPARRAWYRTPLGRRSDPAQWKGMRALSETNSFSEFIRHPDVRSDPGFRPQTSMVHDTEGRHLVTRIVKFENITEELAEVQRAIGIDPPLELPRRNESGRTPRREEIVPTDDDIALLASYFAKDYEAFGYTER